MGINLMTLLWTNGKSAILCDCRIYDKVGPSKNHHFIDMLAVAKERGFAPAMVCFDARNCISLGWYSGLENLKAVRSHGGRQRGVAPGWHFLTRLKSNRVVHARVNVVNPDDTGNVSVSLLAIPASGMTVHLKGFGFVQVFRTVGPNGHAEPSCIPARWVTSDLSMSEEQREEQRAVWERELFAIETYHRGLKQCCGVERCQSRGGRAQSNHIFLSVRAFVRLERHRFIMGRLVQCQVSNYSGSHAGLLGKPNTQTRNNCVSPI